MTKPAHIFHDEDLQVIVWRFEIRPSACFLALSRRYKDGTWEETTMLDAGELPRLAALLTQAHAWIGEQGAREDIKATAE